MAVSKMSKINETIIGDGDILMPSEIEMYVQHITPSNLENLGSPLWFESHHRLQKLSQQSTLEAGEMREETVKELIISYNKVHTIIHEAILIQVWREKIFKQIINTNEEANNTFIPYIVLYHEITAVSLLQNILFHKDFGRSMDDAILDLIDYCAAEIIRLLAQDPQDREKSSEEISNLEELKRQCSVIGFNIGLSCVCILSYCISYMDELTQSAVNRLYDVHDVPLLLANLIQAEPWKQTNSKTNILQIYEDGSWKNAEKVSRMSKYEGQCWMALRYLLLDPRCSQQYEFSNFRKECLTKVQKYLHETTIDQISPLIELKQFLAQLSFLQPSAPRKPLLMETIPEIRTNILAQGFKKWKQMVAKHRATMLESSEEDAAQVARRLGETYNMDHIERMLQEPAICSACGDHAAKKCSRCKAEWYCGRECQVKRWIKHKPVCSIMKEASSS